MKVFVTGGTGTIGDLLVRNLLDTGHSISVLTRNRKHVTNSWNEEVNIVEGDPKEKGSWMDSISDHDIVINLVGADIFEKRWTEKRKKVLYDSRVKSIRNIVEAIKNTEGRQLSVISVSGVDYYPTDKEKVYTEDDEPSDGFLGNLTQDWEQPVIDLKSTQHRGVVFRMGVAFTYSGQGAERMFKPHKFFIGGWIGSGKQLYSWIHIKDFVGLILWGLENNEIDGVYNGVAPDVKSMKELAKIGGSIMGRWTWTWVPGFVLRIILGERAKLLLKGREVSSQKVIDEGYEFQFPTAKEALEDILEDF